LIIVFTAAAAMSLVGAGVSLLRGSQFYYDAPDGTGSTGPVTRAPNGSAPRTPANGGPPPAGRPARPGSLAPAPRRPPPCPLFGCAARRAAAPSRRGRP